VKQKEKKQSAEPLSYKASFENRQFRESWGRIF
jgi:hypothetical protein